MLPWPKFLDDSTINGLRYLYMSKTRLKRIVWVLAFFSAIGICIWSFTTNAGRYYDYKVKTVISTKRIDPMPFPSISFMNIHPMRASGTDYQMFMQVALITANSRDDLSHIMQTVSHF